MPCRKANDFSKLPLLPLTAQTLQAFDQLLARSGVVQSTGVSGIINENMPPGEAFQRLMSNNLYLEGDDHPEAQQDLIAFLTGQPQQTHINDAKRSGFSETVCMQVEQLHSYASAIMHDRLARSYLSAQPKQQQEFLTICDTPTKNSMNLAANEFDRSCENSQRLLSELNRLMDTISQAELPDKVQRACEAAYTMATAEIPLTYDEAKARVSKTTLIAPKRGGTAGPTP